MKINSIKYVSVILFSLATLPVAALEIELPTRKSPIPETTNGVPHVQIDIQPVPERSERLLKEVDRFVGDVRPRDDLSLVVIQRKGEP